MANRPTIEQVASKAGVSVATVDRVLNKRAAVRARTAKRVHEAALQIGYHASGLIAQRMREDLPQFRLGFLLLDTGAAFYDELAGQLTLAVAEASDFRGVIQIDRANPQAPEEIVAKLRQLASHCAALAVVAPEHPSVSAVVAELAERGVPVFALLSDFAAGQRSAYVGVHNGKVGRTAAWMIATGAKKPGKVALFVGSHRFHGHEAREMGFRSFFREEAPQFTLLETLVNFEDSERTRATLIDLTDGESDVVGCYVAGGGMEGAVAAMRAIPRERRPILVCNELTPISSAALADRVATMVINTPTAAISRGVVRLMADTLRSGGNGRTADCFVPFEVYLPESI